MAGSFTKLYFHGVFAVKYRNAMIDVGWEDELFSVIEKPKFLKIKIMVLSSNLRKALLLFAAALILFGLVKSPMFGYDEIIGKNGRGFEFGYSISSFVPLGFMVLVTTLYIGRKRS